ncbi:hypothetical protein BJ986_003124 [Phycicoccus badiiscoriae]|uniref:IrrE N-terminal-like domain-containing protein n=1 Tax=Pedococcus badiiscoriae TaxID=642776 RepID=A0A852WHF8_9MICO|nr:hypothetical protein [Pedococcus badiiscoriae]NYG08637.1 hypothetical protein [Pedococcus badiiscoriae]
MISSARHRASRAALATARHLLPADGSITGLVEAVATHRGRPIDLLPAHLGPRSSAAFLVQGHGQDYILYAAGADPHERDLAICHQLAHLLMGHGIDPVSRPPIGATTATPTSSGRTRYLAVHGYGSAQETQAARFARSITAAASARDRRGVWTRSNRVPDGSRTS